MKNENSIETASILYYYNASLFPFGNKKMTKNSSMIESLYRNFFHQKAASLYKADISIRRSEIDTPMVSAFHCFFPFSSKVFLFFQNFIMFLDRQYSAWNWKKKYKIYYSNFFFHFNNILFIFFGQQLY